MSGLLHSLGSFAARRWAVVLGACLVALVIAVAASHQFGGDYSNQFTIPGSESQRAIDDLKANFPARAGATTTIVLHDAAGSLSDPPATAALQQSLGAVAKLPHVTNVAQPGKPGFAATQDGKTAYAGVSYDVQASGLAKSDYDALRLAMAPASSAGLQVEYEGDLIRKVERPDVGASDEIGVVVALVVLLLAFGSVFAAGMPLVTAIFALGIGLSVVKLLAALQAVPSVTPTLATMLGLGVGIDYALFIVTRHRDELAQRRPVAEAVGRAISTAGQSVLFAGSTVVLAVCGLAIAGIPFVTTLGYATAIVVAITVCIALTLLPALLGLAGPSLDKLRLPWLTDEPPDDENGLFWRLGHHVARHPWPFALGSLALVLLLAVPTAFMRLGQNDAGTLPTSSTQRRAYDLLTAGFGKGFNGPLTVVVETQPGDSTSVSGVSQALSKDDDVAVVSPPQPSPDGKTTVLSAVPKSSPQDDATTQLVQRLRRHELPAAVGSGGRVLVTGSTAQFIDLADRILSRLPWFIAAVVCLSFLLLMMAFRSLLVPLKAAIMNLLSVGAAYGIVVAVFQWGWGRQVIGLQETVPIVSYVPMLMFAVLFGLSMDYEVFLLSRVREEYLRTGDSRASVVRGLAATGKVITSAAVIMASVFLSFVLVDDPVVKMFGVGLASAVIVDSTVIRMIMVPATMELLGDANWWLPSWLDRVLPHIDIEGEAGEGEVPAAEAEAPAS